MFGHQDSSNHDANAQPAAPAADGVLTHPVAPQTFAPTADDQSRSFIPQPTTPLPAPDTGSLPTAPAAETPNMTAGSPTVADPGLLELKQAALQELTPLIDHLEQTAEEKFRTMMMMIQASDDQSLLAEAYQAAQSIEDKKARAQALLDVVNEINYFTQQHHDNA